MIMAERDILHITTRDKFQESVNSKYSIDNISGYLITCRVTSGAVMEKITGPKKK